MADPGSEVLRFLCTVTDQVLASDCEEVDSQES